MSECTCSMFSAPMLILELADRLADAGFADDASELEIEITAFAESYGLVPRYTTGGLRGWGSRHSRAEWKRLVDEYMAFSSTVKSSNRRHEKLRALGVSAMDMCRWARKFYGPRALTRGNRSLPDLVLEYLGGRGWMTAAQISLGTALPVAAVHPSLGVLFKRELLKRRKNAQRLLEYKCI